MSTTATTTTDAVDLAGLIATGVAAVGTDEVLAWARDVRFYVDGALYEVILCYSNDDGYSTHDWSKDGKDVDCPEFAHQAFYYELDCATSELAIW